MITFIFFTSITSIMENGFRKIVLIKLMSREFHIFLKRDDDDEYFPLWCCEYYLSFFVHAQRTLSIEVDIFHALRWTMWTMWTCFYAFMSSPHPPLLSEPLGTLVNCLLPHCQEKAAICIISCTYSVKPSLVTICIYLGPFKEESVPDVEVSIHWKSVHEKTKEPGS